MADETLKVGGLLSGQKLYIEGPMLKYEGAYKGYFIVRLRDIETVAVDQEGWGNCRLRIIGKGSELASIKLPMKWAAKAQIWILNRINTR